MSCYRPGLLLLLLLSQTFGDVEPERPLRRLSVIVVGAGVSGFTAAATLLEHNVTDILLLEASDRIGGRIHTVQFGGVPIDKGAEFIHGEKDNAVYELVSPYNLLASYKKTLLQEDKFLFVNTSGHVFNSSYVKRLIDKAYAIMYEDDAATFNGSVADYFFPRLDKLIVADKIDPLLGEAIYHLVPLLEGVYSAAANLSELGSRGTSDYWENEGDLTLKWKTGGYKTIFDFISKKFPEPSAELPVQNRTVFGKQVTRIDRKDGQVEVLCADGSGYVADHVIVTFSLGVLKKHAATMFYPPLPADKTAAIQALGFGCVGKVFMLFPTRWWTDNINVITPLFTQKELQDFKENSTHGYWTSSTTGFHPVTNHDRMLCAWFAGDSCRTMETLSEEQVLDGLMELLNTILRNIFEIPKAESILRTGWASNPYTLGSYSFRTVESDNLNITNNILGSPITEADKPVIMFGGEATHPHYSSTVHGALAAGRREALNLIEYLKK